MRQKSIPSRIPLIVPVFLVMLLLPWSKHELKSSYSIVSNKPEPNNNYIELRNFPVLRISQADMINLFAKGTGPAVKKLVFKFNINEAEARNPSLTVFRAKKNGRKYIPGATTTLSRTTETCEINGEYTLGNLELDDKSWLQVLRRAPNTNSFLYFYPVKEQYNGIGLYNVVYKLYWGDETRPPLDGCNRINVAPPPPPDGGLNPSPPADPS